MKFPLRIYRGKSGRQSKNCFETHYAENFLEIWWIKTRFLFCDTKNTSDPKFCLMMSSKRGIASVYEDSRKRLWKYFFKYYLPKLNVT